jgi:hypothetical protein
MTKADTWQTRPLVREGAQKRQDSKFEKKKILWSKVPDWARHQDILTDWLTASRNVTLTLTWLFWSFGNCSCFLNLPPLFNPHLSYRKGFWICRTNFMASEGRGKDWPSFNNNNTILHDTLALWRGKSTRSVDLHGFLTRNATSRLALAVGLLYSATLQCLSMMIYSSSAGATNRPPHFVLRI